MGKVKYMRMNFVLSLVLSISFLVGTDCIASPLSPFEPEMTHEEMMAAAPELGWSIYCLLYTSDAADE